MMTNQAQSCDQIFVVGNSRSGTTLMGRILGKHPLVYTFNELHFFEERWSPDTQTSHIISRSQAIEVMAHLIDVQRNGYLTQTNADQFMNEAQGIASKLSEPIAMPTVFGKFINYEAELNQKQIPCEQTPRNVFYIGEILKFFPNAKIINMIRDPRDILLSQKRRWRRPFLSDNIPVNQAFRYWINYHPITISKLWNASMGSANHFLEEPRLYSVRFEDLLTSPEVEVKKICEFIGLPFEDSMLDIPQVGSSSEQDQIERRGINSERAESWRKGGLSGTEIFLCQRMTSTFMEQYGYPIEPTRLSWFLLIFSFISFPFKLILALVLSLNRMRRISETIKRRVFVPNPNG